MLSIYETKTIKELSQTSPINIRCSSSLSWILRCWHRVPALFWSICFETKLTYHFRGAHLETDRRDSLKICSPSFREWNRDQKGSCSKLRLLLKCEAPTNWIEELSNDVDRCGPLEYDIQHCYPLLLSDVPTLPSGNFFVKGEVQSSIMSSPPKACNFMSEKDRKGR